MNSRVRYEKVCADEDAFMARLSASAHSRMTSDYSPSLFTFDQQLHSSAMRFYRSCRRLLQHYNRHRAREVPVAVVESVWTVTNCRDLMDRSFTYCVSCSR
jgi:hypothetical protein